MLIRRVESEGFAHTRSIQKEVLKSEFNTQENNSSGSALDRMATASCGLEVKSVRFGNGYCRFVKKEDEAKYREWLVKHLPGLMTQVPGTQMKGYVLRLSVIEGANASVNPNVEQDVNLITASIEPMPAPVVAAPESTREERHENGMQRLKQALQEVQGDLLVRIDSLTQLVERQHALLSAQGQTIEQLKAQVGSLKAEPIYVPAQPTKPSGSIFSRLFN